MVQGSEGATGRWCICQGWWGGKTQLPMTRAFCSHSISSIHSGKHRLLSAFTKWPLRKQPRSHRHPGLQQHPGLQRHAGLHRTPDPLLPRLRRSKTLHASQCWL